MYLDFIRGFFFNFKVFKITTFRRIDLLSSPGKKSIQNAYSVGSCTPSYSRSVDLLPTGANRIKVSSSFREDKIASVLRKVVIFTVLRILKI
jgi:hypothetical protein